MTTGKIGRQPKKPPTPTEGVAIPGIERKWHSPNREVITKQKSMVKALIKKRQEDLPHLYGWKWYRWAFAFFESKNRMNLMTSGNQCGKSLTLIRKNIEWACNKKLWPTLWKTEPRQFWYFYPSIDVVQTEFAKKWVPDLLPRGDMKNDPEYGWDAIYSGGAVDGIQFRSGVTLYFKTYGQRSINLQTSSCHMVSADEEMPENYTDECLARLAATEGYFNMVFTATQGFPLWYRAMECIGTSDEVFKDAFKLAVSLYDCQTFQDGTPGEWTLEKIKQREAMCSSQAEIQKRVFGRFVRSDGKRYQSFAPEKLHLDPEPVPSNWKIYGGVDIGSGGGTHRSAGAIVFIAADPLFTRGRVIMCWRGEYEETSAGDILAHFQKLRSMLPGPVIQACYDPQSREFGIIASRAGENFIQADKARESGDQILNTLFAKGALTVDRTGDSQKLVVELMSIPGMKGEKNRKYRDDLCDALRYTAKMIPWDFAAITNTPAKAEPTLDLSNIPPTGEAEYRAWELRQRRGEMDKPLSSEWGEFYQEIEEWNNIFEGRIA